MLGCRRIAGARLSLASGALGGQRSPLLAEGAQGWAVPIRPERAGLRLDGLGRAMPTNRLDTLKAVVEAWKDYKRHLGQMHQWDQGGEFHPLMADNGNKEGEVALRLAIAEVLGSK